MELWSLHWAFLGLQIDIKKVLVKDSSMITKLMSLSPSLKKYSWKKHISLDWIMVECYWLFHTSKFQPSQNTQLFCLVSANCYHSFRLQVLFSLEKTSTHLQPIPPYTSGDITEVNDVQLYILFKPSLPLNLLVLMRKGARWDLQGSHKLMQLHHNWLRKM